MKPLLLTIMDGVGLSDETKGNAFRLANTPNLDYLMSNYQVSELEASGEEVGLPKGQIGNSEVGHLNIGAGRIVYQPLELINKEIENGDFYHNQKILSVINHVKENQSRLQIFGLLSDGGVHSHIEHLLAILDMCKNENINEVYLHLFTDGRDTLTDSSEKYFNLLQEKINELKLGKIATISGRYYAMDRDNRWERIKHAYEAIVNGSGEYANSYQDVIKSNYSKQITDEFIIPTVLDNEGCIKDGDGLLIFNYRPDRLRELFAAITNDRFECFERVMRKNLKLVTMMGVSSDVIYEQAFQNQTLTNTLGEWLSQNNLNQLRIAETEKYAHVTYFLDGGIDKEIPGCDRILIPSPQVTTYDLTPKMSAEEITNTLLSKLDSDDYDVIILNYANGDMLGHTGKIKAAIQAIETVDYEIGRLYNKIKEKQGLMIVTADHGNCEIMLDKDNNIITSHTTSKVPFIICDKKYSVTNGKLADIAPTILNILKIEVPKEMTGTNLLTKEDNNN